MKCLTLMAVIFMAATPSFGAQAAPTDSDAREVQSYKLTLPVMKQMVAATRSMVTAGKESGELQRLQTSAANMMAAAKSLSDLEAAIQREPLAVKALKSAGLSAREYAKFMLAFFQSSMLYSMQKSGAISEIPKTANADNLKFVEANQAQITTLMAEFRALAQKP